MNRGIHTRGYLPHWHFAESVQAITLCLADSVPKLVIAAMGVARFALNRCDFLSL